MHRWSSAVRWIAWGAAGFVAVFVVLGVAAYAYVQTEAGRQTLAEFVSSALSGPGTDVSIGSIGPGFPMSLSVQTVTVRDEQGAWLTVERAALDWRPLALLSGRLHVTDVDAGGVHLDRLPTGSESVEVPDDTQAEPLDIPSLPVDIQVDRIQVRDIALSEAVVGEAMVLDLSGQVAGEVGAMVRTDLRLERTDAAGLVTLVSELDPSTQTLSVDLEVSERKGGLIARLLDLAPYPPVAITLKGEGPLSAWRADLDARIEGLVDVTARLRVDHQQVTNVSLDGRADVDGMLEPPLKPLVAGGVNFSLAAHLRDLDSVTVEHLGVKTKALTAAGSGRVDLAGDSLDASVSITAQRGDVLDPVLSPLRVGSIVGDIKLSGALTAPAVDLAATVRKLAAPGMFTAERLDIAAETDLSVVPVGIDARIDGHGLDVAEPAIAALTGDAATIKISGTYDTLRAIANIDGIDANSGPTALAAHGQFGASTQQVTAALDVTVADVSALGQALGIPLSGPARLSAETEGNLETLNLKGSVRGDLSRPSVGQTEADELLRDGVRLSGSYALDGADAVRFDADVEAGKLLQVHAKGRIEDAMAVNATVKADNLSAFSRLVGIPLSGALSMKAHAEGSVEDVTGTLTATLRNAGVDAVAIPSADLKVDAKDLMQSPSGRLTLDARTSDGPMSLRTDFTLAEFASLDLRDLKGEVLGLRISGNVRAPLDGGAMSGRLRANFEEPSGIAVAGVGVAGRAEADLVLGDEVGKQSADLRLEASSLSLTMDGEEALQAERLMLTAALKDLLGLPRGTAKLEFRDIGSAAFTVRSLTAEVDGSLADAEFQARMDGPTDPDVRVALAGLYAAKGDTHTVILQRLDGALGTYPLKLAGPAKVTYAPDAIGVERLSVGVGKGTVTSNGRLGGARTQATFRIAALPLDLIGQFDPSVPFEGTLDANADVRAEGNGLGGNMSIRGQNVSYGGPRLKEAPPVDMSVDAVWRGGRVKVDARIAGIGGSDLVATAAGPLMVNARTLQATVDERAPIAAKARWEGQLETLWEMLPLSDQRLAGLGRIVFDVTGTVAQPRPNGEITVKNGTYEQFVAGTLIKDLDLSATVDRAQVVKITLSGNDGGTGRISGSGTANVSDLGGKPIEVTVRFDQATLVRRDDVTASATGSVSFRGTVTKGRLEGKITTDRVDVRLVNQLPPSVVTLGVTEVHAKGDPRSGIQESQPAEPSQIDLDITLDLPKAVYVKGRGLESEWGGSFHVTGTTGAPRVEGILKIIRGQFTFAGKRFNLTKGVVTLDGGKEIEPRIDIVAEYTEGDFSASITITGKASDPKLALSSSPPLPEGEILPRVLFGKDSSQLSVTEAAQLALALQGLASGGSSIGDDVLSKIQDTLGIDVLSVESTGEDGQGTGVRIGRYIGDRVYVETVQGTQPGSTVYRVEVKIIDNLSAVSSVGQGTTNASGFLGLQWQYRY